MKRDADPSMLEPDPGPAWQPALSRLAEAVAAAERAPSTHIEELKAAFFEAQGIGLGHPASHQHEPADLICRAAVVFVGACLPELAASAASLAGRFARSSGQRQVLRRALVVHAIGLSEVGDYPGSIGCLNEALDVANEMGDIPGQCAVWNQVGLVLHLQNQALEAVAAFERILELADGEANLLPYRLAALANIGLLGLDVMEFSERGLRAALAALALSPQPSTHWDRYNRVSLETVAARLLARFGELEAAKKHADKALEYSTDAGDRAAALAEIAIGTVLAAGEAKEQGIARLQSAVSLARHRVKALHFYALRALIGAYETTGQPEVAKVYLEELMRLSGEAKEKRLLEQHHAHVEAVLRQHEGSSDLMEQDIKRQRDRLNEKNLSRESVRSMMLLLEEHANAAELHDDSTSKHIYRVGRMSALIAKEIGLDESTQFMLDLSARLHDTGKLFVPDAILLKPGKLTDSERAIMQTHTTSGAEYLRKTGLPMIEVATEIALCHHERFDGKGYPAGLKGSAIPISARIAALADVFDALTHERPYKSAWSIPEALAEIRSLRGTHFDPDLTDVFLLLVPRLQRETGDLDSFLAAEAENSRFVQTRRALAAKLKGLDPAVSAFELRR